MPLLETDDMLMMKNKPDWKCVFTYVQSLYRYLSKIQLAQAAAAAAAADAEAQAQEA